MPPDTDSTYDSGDHAARGYGSASYGRSFRDLGRVVTLPRSGLQLIERSIDGIRFDLAGLYPLSVCHDWDKLSDDVATMRDMGAVSVVLVADPFAEEAARGALSHWKVCRRFKKHVVVDLREDWRAARAKNVRNSASQALRRQSVDLVERPADHGDAFWALYQNTLERHSVTGIQRLSLAAITEQLAVEGVMMVVARRDGTICGALFGYDQGEIGHLHLMGQTAEGYSIKTSYGLIHRFLEALEGRGCLYANLGGPSGLVDDPGDGLFRFKSRWAKHRRTSLLCGEILDAEAYASLAERAPRRGGDFFPAYRTPAPDRA